MPPTYLSSLRSRCVVITGYLSLLHNNFDTEREALEKRLRKLIVTHDKQVNNKVNKSITTRIVHVLGIYIFTIGNPLLYVYCSLRSKKSKN